MVLLPKKIAHMRHKKNTRRFDTGHSRATPVGEIIVRGANIGFNVCGWCMPHYLHYTSYSYIFDRESIGMANNVPSTGDRIIPLACESGAPVSAPLSLPTPVPGFDLVRLAFRA